MTTGAPLRFRDVELRLLYEITLILLVFASFGSVVAESLGWWPPAVAGLLLFPVVLSSIRKRWIARLTAWRRMLEWSREPIAFDGALVVQENEQGRRVGVIDPKQHYTVRWERFSSDRALYLVTQDEQTVAVSALAPNAPHILRDILHVANYSPCEDWPNIDL